MTVGLALARMSPLPVSVRRRPGGGAFAILTPSQGVSVSVRESTTFSVSTSGRTRFGCNRVCRERIHSGQRGAEPAETPRPGGFPA